jgi:hypothetical protein
VELEQLTLPEHLSFPPVFSGVRVTRSLVLYLCFTQIFHSGQPSHGGRPGVIKNVIVISCN